MLKRIKKVMFIFLFIFLISCTSEIKDTNQEIEEKGINQKINPLKTTEKDTNHNEEINQDQTDQNILNLIKQSFDGKLIDLMSTSLQGVNHQSTSRTLIYLCSNGDFAFESTESDYSAGDSSIFYGNGEKLSMGKWNIIQEDKIISLALQFNDEIVEYEIDYNSEENRFYLNGIKAFLLDNPLCN